MKESKNIGFGIPAPKELCEDVNCPFHGEIKIRGRILIGTISSKTGKNVTIEILSRRYVPKYERYVKIRTKIKAHNPECIKTNIGDKVKIAETRPISKTKNFVVVQVMNDIKEDK